MATSAKATEPSGEVTSFKRLLVRQLKNFELAYCDEPASGAVGLQNDSRRSESRYFRRF